MSNINTQKVVIQAQALNGLIFISVNLSEYW